jgi:hypothetical protein
VKWTRERPTAPGWYWIRCPMGPTERGEWRTELVEVRAYPGELVVFVSTWITGRPLGEFAGEWAGPLLPPGEE